MGSRTRPSFGDGHSLRVHDHAPFDDSEDERWMRLALDQARLALDEGEVPSAPFWSTRTETWSPPITIAANNWPTPPPTPRCWSCRRRPSGWRLATDRTHPLCHPGALPDVRRSGRGGQARHPCLRSRRSQSGAAWSLYNIPQDVRLNHRTEMRQGVLATEASEILSGFFERLR